MLGVRPALRPHVAQASRPVTRISSSCGFSRSEGAQCLLSDIARVAVVTFRTHTEDSNGSCDSAATSCGGVVVRVVASCCRPAESAWPQEALGRLANHTEPDSVHSIRRVSGRRSSIVATRLIVHAARPAAVPSHDIRVHDPVPPLPLSGMPLSVSSLCLCQCQASLAVERTTQHARLQCPSESANGVPHTRNKCIQISR